MYKLIQNNLLWWGKRRWLYYSLLCALTYASALIALKRMPQQLHLFVFLVAIYLGFTSYSFVLLFHRIGLQYENASAEDRDVSADFQLFINIMTIALPVNYIIYDAFNWFGNSRGTSLLTLFIIFLLGAISYWPATQLLERDFESRKGKLIGVLIFVLLCSALGIFGLFPVMNEGLRLLINKGWL